MVLVGAVHLDQMVINILLIRIKINLLQMTLFSQVLYQIMKMRTHKHK